MLIRFPAQEPALMTIQGVSKIYGSPAHEMREAEINYNVPT